MSDKEVMQMALDALTKPHPGVRTDLSDAVVYREVVKTAIDALRAALAQLKPEPLGWIVMHEGMNIDELSIHEVEQMGYDEKPMPNQYRVYISPPQREWVSLTKNEKELLWDEAVDGREHFCSQYGDFADAIEAKLKEKNSTTEKIIQISDNND